MLDVSAAGNGEAEASDALLRSHMASGLIAHLHVNDRNRRAPGLGPTRRCWLPRKNAAIVLLHGAEDPANPDQACAFLCEGLHTTDA